MLRICSLLNQVILAIDHFEPRRLQADWLPSELEVKRMRAWHRQKDADNTTKTPQLRLSFKHMANSIPVRCDQPPVLSPHHLQDLRCLLLKSVDQVSVPGHSAQAWNDLKSVCLLSMCIEQQGVVQGLAWLIENADDALSNIYTRNMASSRWQMKSPSEAELAGLRQLADVHIFQLSQLGLREFEWVIANVRCEILRMPLAVESEAAVSSSNNDGDQKSDEVILSVRTPLTSPACSEPWAARTEVPRSDSTAKINTRSLPSEVSNNFMM